MYRSNGNPAGYEPSVEPEGDSLYTFGKRTTILDDNVSVNGVQCTNYIRQDGVSVTASSENGNGGIGIGDLSSEGVVVAEGKVDGL